MNEYHRTKCVEKIERTETNVIFIQCCAYSWSKTTTTTTKIPINSVINIRKEIKLIPINMNYCLLQFDKLNLFLGGPSTWRVSNFEFFLVNPQI